MLWAYAPEDPGQTLSHEDAVALCRYMRARWEAYHVVWLLGGDGHYAGEGAVRWKRLGRSVFDARAPGRSAPLQARPVTMHPCGLSWVTEEFRHEPWFDFHGYQSGHGDSDEHLRWLQKGPPGEPWQRPPVHPIINLEPNYETHKAYHSGGAFSDYHVRRAAYWSLLATPSAGVTYGNNATLVVGRGSGGAPQPRGPRRRAALVGRPRPPRRRADGRPARHLWGARVVAPTAGAWPAGPSARR